MSIGETLADARRRAGLTITQVSRETRIRESIIRDIEQGDFSTCGGDFYVSVCPGWSPKCNRLAFPKPITGGERSRFLGACSSLPL